MILVSLQRSCHKTLIRVKEETGLKSDNLALRDHLSKNRKVKPLHHILHLLDSTSLHRS